MDEITEDGEDAVAEGGGGGGSASGSSSSLTAAQRYKAARRGDNLSKRAERAERSAASLQVSGVTPPSLSPRLSPLANSLESGDTQSSRENSGSATSADPRPAVENSSPNVGLGIESITAPSQSPDLQVTAAERPTEESALETKTVEASRDTSAGATAPTSIPDLPVTPPQTSRGGDAEVSASETPAASEASQSIRGVSMDDDPYDLSKYDSFFKPKVKLGPRPVTAAERAMRPARVSAVPASFRQARKSENIRPQSQGGKGDAANPAPAPAEFDHAPQLPPPPIPVDYNPRPYSRGSVKSAPSHRSTAMTPDRLRLMKAVELRKRQLRKSQEPSSFIAPAEEERPEMPTLLLHTVSEPLTTTLNKQAQHKDGEAEQSTTDDESHPQSSKADSGIEIRNDTPSVDGLDERTPSVPENVPENTIVHHSQPSTMNQQQVPAVPTEATGEDVSADENTAPSVDRHTPTEPAQATQQEDDRTPDIPSIELVDPSRPPTSEGNAHLEATTLEHAQSSETLRSAEPMSRPVSSDLTRRRRGLVEPLHITMPSGNPDDFMSDDEFLEELHSATVQEARPIMFAHQASIEDMSSVRSVSITRNPSGRSNAEHLSPQSSPAVPVASPSEKTDPAWNAPRKVSSGISRRIQALNEVSTREANASGHSIPSSPLSPDSAHNTFLHRDHRQRRAPSPAARPVSFRRPNKNSSNNQTPVVTPPVGSPPSWSVQHNASTSRNSVSVNARIVRPRTQPDESQLMQSELTINGNRDAAADVNPGLPPIDIDAAQNSNISSPALSPSSRGSGEKRTLHSASGRFGRRGKSKSVTSPATPEMVDFPAPPNQRVSTASINTENSSSKLSTRTSRFFKRVSTFSGPKKRRSEQSVKDTASVVSLESGPGTKTASRVSVATHRSDTPPAVVVGDLNVQFPDSLVRYSRHLHLSQMLTYDNTTALETPHRHNQRPRRTPIRHCARDGNPQGRRVEEFPVAAVSYPVCTGSGPTGIGEFGHVGVGAGWDDVAVGV